MAVFNPIICSLRVLYPPAARYFSSLMIAVMLGVPSCALGLAFELEDDRLSIHAVNVPLQDVLKRFTDYGIAIRIDPDINPQVTAMFENRDLEAGLKAILKAQNHVFFWKRIVRDQAGRPVEAYALDEIHVFRPGLKGRMVTFDAAASPPDRPPKAASLPRTKVKIDANRVIVPVTLGYQDRTVDTTLIFDTGAGSVVLHDNIAVALGIDDTQVSRGIGVGGIEIEARTTRLQFVQVGPHKKDNLRADIIAYQGTPDPEYNGLLGMNFIRGLKYTIDFNNQIILWNR